MCTFCLYCHFEIEHSICNQYTVKHLNYSSAINAEIGKLVSVQVFLLQILYSSVAKNACAVCIYVV